MGAAIVLCIEGVNIPSRQASSTAKTRQKSESAPGSSFFLLTFLQLAPGESPLITIRSHVLG